MPPSTAAAASPAKTKPRHRIYTSLSGYRHVRDAAIHYRLTYQAVVDRLLENPDLVMAAAKQLVDADDAPSIWIVPGPAGPPACCCGPSEITVTYPPMGQADQLCSASCLGPPGEAEPR